MNIYPVTDRILKIHTQLLNTPMQRKQYPRSSYGNHALALHWLRGYLAGKNADTTLVRRSLAQACEMEKFEGHYKRK